jgi:hypothetical protein
MKQNKKNKKVLEISSVIGLYDSNQLSPVITDAPGSRLGRK